MRDHQRCANVQVDHRVILFSTAVKNLQTTILVLFACLICSSAGYPVIYTQEPRFVPYKVDDPASISIASKEKPVSGDKDVSLRLRKDLLFYMTFDNTLDPRVPERQLIVSGPYKFIEGKVRAGLAINPSDDRKLGTVPATRIFPYLEGAVSFWYRPEVNARNQSGSESQHILSVSTPGRFYLVKKPDGIQPQVAYAKQGVFSKHWLNELVYRSNFGGSYPKIRWDPNRWYHFTWTWDEYESVTYLDGVRVSVGGRQPEGVGTDNYFGQDMQIAGYANGKYLASGSIDELGIWGRKLDAGEVENIYRKGIDGEHILPDRPSLSSSSVADQIRHAALAPGHNVIDNGSFEAGISNYFYAANPYFSPPIFTPDRFEITADTSYHGLKSLKITIPAAVSPDGIDMPGYFGKPGVCALHTLRMSVNPASDYMLGLAIKSNEKARLRLSVHEVWQDESNKMPIKMREYQLTDEWKYISLNNIHISGTTEYVSLRIEITSEVQSRDAVVYLDAIQLAESDEKYVLANRFAPKRVVTGVLRTDYPGNIITTSKSPNYILATVSNNTDSDQQARATLKITDVFSNEMTLSDLVIKLAAHDSKHIKGSLGNLGYGVYRAVLSIDGTNDAVDSLVFSVVQPASTIAGTGIHVLADDYSLIFSKRLGIEWLRLWDTTHMMQWHKIQPQRFGELQWGKSNQYLDKMASYGFRILPVLYHVSSWTPSADTGVPPHWIFNELEHSNKGGLLLGDMQLINAWSKYVYEMVLRYKHIINSWEVMNEPYNEIFGGWSPSEYIEFLQITRKAIKDADPNANIVGPVAYSNPSWVVPMLENGLLDLIDVFSFHGYSLDAATLEKIKLWAAYGGKSKPLFDTENSGVLDNDDFRTGAGGSTTGDTEDTLRSIASHAQLVIQEKAIGTKVIFEYLAKPYPPYSGHHSLMAFDGTAAPGLIAYVTVSRMLADYMPAGIRHINDYILAYRFESQDTDEAVTAFFDRRLQDENMSGVLKLIKSDGIEVYDVFGNRSYISRSNKVQVGAVPIFVKSKKSRQFIKSFDFH